MRLFLSLTFALAMGGVAAALLLPGWSDLLLIAGPVAIASAFLWSRQSRTPARYSGDGRPKLLVIDGSNAMFWQDNTPRLHTVAVLLDLLHSKGYKVCIIFDASAGHVLFGRYLDDRHFAERLGLPESHCLVVPKGTIADKYILCAARDLNARVVTNDLYRDWAENFPEVATPGFLIKGDFDQGLLRLYGLHETHDNALPKG